MNNHTSACVRDACQTLPRAIGERKGISQEGDWRKQLEICGFMVGDDLRVQARPATQQISPDMT